MEKNSLNRYIISAEELQNLLYRDNIVIIDTREPEDYLFNHIPGAINIYEIFTYLSTRENGGYEAMASLFAGLFGKAGIGGNEKVIIYEDAMDNGYGRSCRGWFILNYLGYKNAAVLHGGYQAWLQKEFPVTKDIPFPAPKTFPVNIDKSIIVDVNEMRFLITDKEHIILDVRDHAEWIGVSSSPYGPDFAPRKGRLPGARWIEWYNMMKTVDSIPWFKSKDELIELFTNAGITKDDKVVIYCFKGARTSNVYICMQMAGIINVRCYFGAWNEWSRDFSLPIDKGRPKNFS